jgi:hypothetical protein
LVSDVRRGLLHGDQELNDANQVDESSDQYDPFMFILGFQASFEKVLKLLHNDFDGIPYLFTHTNLLPAVAGHPALRDSELTNIPFYISSSGHLCRPFNHKILSVALLRLRLCSIRCNKSDLNLSAKLGISVNSVSLMTDDSKYNMAM